MKTDIQVKIEKNLKPYLHVWPNFNNADWHSSGFSFHKAMVCAAFSRASYWHIPELELKKNSRYKIIPSNEYTMLKEKKISINLEDLLRNVDFNQNFIIETEYVILIGILIGDILFIAIRGTQSLYDGMTDLYIAKKRCQSPSNINYHRGFYNATVGSVRLLVEKLDSIKGKFKLIYTTGHSLGGAIAAILHSLMASESELSKNKFHQKLTHYSSFSCYTFGMPKYGNNAAVVFKSPYCIRHESDLIPRIPPDWLGYKECPNPVVLPNPHSNIPPKEKFILGWKKRLLYTIENHKIENYYQSVKNNI